MHYLTDFFTQAFRFNDRFPEFGKAITYTQFFSCYNCINCSIEQTLLFLFNLLKYGIFVVNLSCHLKKWYQEIHFFSSTIYILYQTKNIHKNCDTQFQKNFIFR